MSPVCGLRQQTLPPVEAAKTLTDADWGYLDRLPLWLELAALPPHHRDPFDRLLVAQARRGGFHLVSHDPEISRYPVPLLW